MNAAVLLFYLISYECALICLVVENNLACLWFSGKKCA